MIVPTHTVLDPGTGGEGGGAPAAGRAARLDLDRAPVHGDGRRDPRRCQLPFGGQQVDQQVVAARSAGADRQPDQYGADRGTQAATARALIPSTRPYEEASREWTVPTCWKACTSPNPAESRKAARATGANLANTALPCGPLQPRGTRTVARARIPPAHRPAASRWAASAVMPHQPGVAPAACPEAASATTASATASETTSQPQTRSLPRADRDEGNHSSRARASSATRESLAQPAGPAVR